MWGVRQAERNSDLASGGEGGVCLRVSSVRVNGLLVNVFFYVPLSCRLVSEILVFVFIALLDE